jgi:hypothetical protein
MNEKVNRDDYFVIFTTMPSGFECKIPARGYNLKSWLAFEDRLGSTYYYERTTQEVYNHLVFGDPGQILDTEDDNGRTKQTEAQQKAPAKRKPRQKASEDSKAVSKPQRASKPAAKRTSSSSKNARTELRKPKVSNVRKPKKDVQGTNNSGKEALPRTRSRKAKTQ